MNDKSRTLVAIAVVAALAFVAFVPVAFIAEDADANTSPGNVTEINIKPGQKYIYTPTYTSGLEVTTVISAQGTGTPSAPTSTSGTRATFSEGTLTVNFATATVGETYYVIMHASTTNPTQDHYYSIAFTVVSGFSVSGSISNIVVGQSIDTTPTVSGQSGTVSWALKSGSTLPTGLTLDAATGKISGTVNTAGSYSFTVTATDTITVSGTTTSSQDLTYSFVVVSSLDLTNSPANGAIIYAS